MSHILLDELHPKKLSTFSCTERTKKSIQPFFILTSFLNYNSTALHFFRGFICLVCQYALKRAYTRFVYTLIPELHQQDDSRHDFHLHFGFLLLLFFSVVLNVFRWVCAYSMQNRPNLNFNLFKHHQRYSSHYKSIIYDIGG